VDLEAILAKLAEIGTLTTEELQEIEDLLLDGLNDAKSRMDEASREEKRDILAETEKIVEAVKAVRDEKVKRAEEDRQNDEAFDALVESLQEPEAAEDEGPEDDDDDTDEDEPEDPEEGEGEPSVEDEPEPVLAAAPTAPRQSRGPSLEQVAGRSAARVPAAPRRDTAVTAKIELSQEGGVRVKNRRQVVEAFVSAHDRYSRAAPGVEVQVPIVHVEWDFPEGQQLSATATAAENGAVLDRLFEPQKQQAALTAAGGICAPFPVQYDLLTLASDVRPVRANLPSVGAPRGGIRFVPPSTLAEIQTTTAAPGTAGSAVSKYTEAMDIAGNAKPKQTFACKSEVECQWYAITRILQFGNFNARTFPEQVDQWVTLTMAAQARFAETLLLQQMAGPTGVLQVDYNGGQRSFLQGLRVALSRQAWGYRQRHRLDPGVNIRVALPDWIHAAVKLDMAERLAYGNEQHEIADSWIDARIRDAGVNPWYFIDGENDIQAMTAAQTDGPTLPFPRTVIGYLYVEGTWVLLDGGSLDLGIVRDSTLNTTNDFQMFAETFEGLCFRGFEAQRLNMTLCINGASAGTYTPDVCGS